MSRNFIRIVILEDCEGNFVQVDELAIERQHEVHVDVVGKISSVTDVVDTNKVEPVEVVGIVLEKKREQVTDAPGEKEEVNQPKVHTPSASVFLDLGLGMVVVVRTAATWGRTAGSVVCNGKKGIRGMVRSRIRIPHHGIMVNRVEIARITKGRRGPVDE